ncbi:MAG: virulence factor SrfB [Deltaproteobacteria bacterium]|jgi:hypothetical protein|nr:virulence factor SrfB [Deltaproteobacteria bacterium]
MSFKRNKSYSVIAGAALQFIDYDIDLSLPFGRGDKPMAKAKTAFHVAKMPGSDQESVLTPLNELEDNPGFYASRLSGQPLALHYEIEYLKAFNCLEGHWLPIPFLVETGLWDDHQPRFGFGPTDWARAYLSRIGSKDSLVFRLTLVFDPQVEPGDGNILVDDGRVVYHALSDSDVAGNAFFSLAAHERDNSWFIDSLPWVKETLKKTWERYRRKNPKAIARPADDIPDYAYDNAAIVTEYMAVYETFLWAVHQSGVLRPVRVINPKRVKPIDVDLVIDIGNSRLTGVLVETVPQRATRLTDCYALQIRDLSRPALSYGEPFDTKVEFAEPYFGPVELSLRSRQHSDSFIWPSTVRLGPEANRLAANSREEMGPTGMSSPKRYLWDTKQRDLEWHLNNFYERHRTVEEPAVGRGSFLMSVNTAGAPLTVVRDAGAPVVGQIPIPSAIKSGYTQDDDIAAFEARYSRSSLMMFLLSEILAQALSCVNNPDVRDNREHPDTPRRLHRVILTVPTAMPLAEQNIFKTWAYLAVETVWSSLKWDEHYVSPFLASDAGATVDFRRSPQVRCEWDEATCTQIVWLYNELYEKFHNNAEELFSLLGRPRPYPDKGDGQDAASLRLASVDVGGGTSDISVTTYFIHNPGQSSPLIKPYQNFRDGFNVAGDDIMRKVIQTQFIRKLAKAAAERGVPDADSLLTSLFKDTAKMGAITANRAGGQLRAQFVAQVAAPVALHVLKLYEAFDLAGDEFIAEINVAEALGLTNEEKPSVRLSEILSYVEAPLQAAGWPSFDLLDFRLKVDLREVDADVSLIVGKILTDMGEIVKLYDCDILILTGRPSCWPAIMRAPYERICLPVDRITHMHKYRVGAAYPFVTHGRIEDPKTTVVVGAIICALAEGSLEGITIDTASFTPQPINRFIGMLDGHGRLSAEHVWFNNVDLDSGREIESNCEIDFNAPVPVGFRQLNCSRWTTTRLYSLDYRSPEDQKRAVGRLPYLVSIEFTMAEQDEEEGRSKKSPIIRRTEGTLKVASVTDKTGQSLAHGTVIIRLQTLRDDNGYWLDTGTLENS